MRRAELPQSAVPADSSLGEGANAAAGLEDNDMKKIRELLPVALLICGVGLLIYAGCLIAPVLGVIIAGLSLIGSSLLMLRGGEE